MMPSTVFELLKERQMPQPRQNSVNDIFGNTRNFFNEFSKFKQSMRGVKNPKTEVERLLQTGEMSQEQYNEISNMLNNMGMRR